MKSLRKAGSNEICTVLGDQGNLDPVRTAVDSEAYDNYRRLWDEASALETVTDFPLQLDFELNYSCNFSCPMCTWSAETTSKFGKDKWFPFEVWKELIDEAVPKGLKSIRLNQMNEPLIRQDIIKFVKYARDAGILDIDVTGNTTTDSLTDPINYFYITSTSNATTGGVKGGGANCSAGPVTLEVVNG